MGFNLGFSSGKSKSGQEIWGPQAEQLKSLYAGAGDFFQAGSPYLTQALESGAAAIPGVSGYGEMALPAWQRLLGGGTPMNMSTAQEIGAGTAPSFGTLYGMQQPGRNPYLDAMFGSAAGRVMDQFQERIMPGITGSAEMTGGLGGSRQGIAEGLAAKGAMQTIGDMASGMYGGAYDADQNRRLQAAQAALTSRLAGTGMETEMTSMGDRLALDALQAGPTAMNLGFTAPNLYQQLYGMQWSPYQYYGDVIGSPTALSYARSKESGGRLGF